MQRKHKYFFLAILILITTAVWWEALRAGEGKLTFWALDIGQGDALFIETPSKNQILIDAGPGRGVLKELGSIMPFYDKSIDLAILTHPHLDHVGGFPGVLKSYDVEAFLGNGDRRRLSEYQETQRLLQEKSIPFLTARRGQKIILDKNVWLEVLYPEKMSESENIHRNMVITMLYAGEKKFLLMGDAEKVEEVFLIEKEREELESDVLKAGHHGSRTSSFAPFLARVLPEYAIISSGEGNSYGHPHKEVLDNLGKVDAKILRTDTYGRIKIETDGREIFISTER